ncbi:unnamed protein product [Toxocara canis]|uniref:Ig-like domain-containing protein n=1 Tax=Toxocara canis TaxID=6265 RepID=A0A183TZ67_TOXCA|nr:unnamed protein product [Toxocara canis]
MQPRLHYKRRLSGDENTEQSSYGASVKVRENVTSILLDPRRPRIVNETQQLTNGCISCHSLGLASSEKPGEWNKFECCFVQRKLKSSNKSFLMDYVHQVFSNKTTYACSVRARMESEGEAR